MVIFKALSEIERQGWWNGFIIWTPPAGGKKQMHVLMESLEGIAYLAPRTVHPGFQLDLRCDYM